MIKLYFFLIFTVCYQWSNAQADGTFQEFYDDGQLQTEGHYKDNRRVGEWKEYHPNGQISAVYSYSNGKWDKEGIYYFDNGAVRREIKKVNNDYITRIPAQLIHFFP